MRRSSVLRFRLKGLFAAAALVAADVSCVPEFQFSLDKEESCNNGLSDPEETDIDCGGVCSPCALKMRCEATSDCGEGSCIEKVCRIPSCADDSLSPGETDIDCGGAHCAPCAALETCELDRDCESESCEQGRCSALARGDGDGDLSGDGDGDGDLGGSGNESGGSGSESSGGADAGGTGGDGNESGGAGSGGAGSGGAGSGGAGSGGAGSGGAGSGGAGSGGAGSGGAGSGGAGTGGAQGVCDEPGLLFCDDFEDGNASGWSLSGGTWSVALASSNYVFTGASGSEEATAGESTWTDQSVRARVRVDQFGGSGGSYRVGIVSRFSGPSNFFTLSLDQAGFARLLKSTSTPSGASGTCGSLSYSANVGTWYDLKMVVTGPSGNVQIRTYINDVLLHDCHTTQTGVAAGQAGVITVGSNTRGSFDDVIVELP